MTNYPEPIDPFHVLANAVDFCGCTDLYVLADIEEAIKCREDRD